MKKNYLTLLLTAILLLTTLPVSANVITEEAKLPFSDTQSGWFVPAVEFCYANGIMSGKSKTTFDPKGYTTREQMMTVLSMLDSDNEAYPQCSFTDVKENVWYTPYVNKAVAKGYTSGISETLFGIGKTLTRQETVTLMYNFTLSSGKEISAEGDLSVFADTENVADWALDAFVWAVGEGIISGNNGNLNPRDAITRAELSQIIKGFCEKILYGGCEHTFTEAGCTTFSECTLCGMKSGMPKGHSCPVLNCTEGSQCTDCGMMIAPKGHKFEGADCSKPMVCSVCNETSGTAMGHTTDRGVCARCGIEIFENSYDKFVYYITESGMTDGNLKYFMANVTHTDGNTSTQYVKYDALTGETTLEIIYKFTGRDISVKTVIYMTGISDVYTVDSYYYVGANTQCHGSAKMTAATEGFVLSSYSGNQTQKTQFENIAKNTVLLCLDASNTLIKKYTGVSMSDFGFSNFN
ncbi:MAG: S-layer homology domain-containing protein [Clostridia bacterium]|nr:S-layer homology domain-containing protein [Clostridia bacterium]